MPGSVSFDRAASFYDRTRSLPAEAMEQVVAQLLPELEGRGRVLEVGVGTGRIALPLQQRGVPITGVDLSMPMMRVLIDKGSGRAPLPLVQADATKLPFGPATFGAVVASHVFHLIPEWAAALDEVARVLPPGGVVLLSGGPGPGRGGPERDLRAFFRNAVGATDAGDHAGRRRAVEEALAARAVSARRLPVVPVRRMISPAEVINSMAAREWSWLWRVPDVDLERGVAETRAWAVRQYGGLDDPQPVESEVLWQVFEL